jgi:hypothetical protein
MIKKIPMFCKEIPLNHKKEGQLIHPSFVIGVYDI